MEETADDEISSVRSKKATPPSDLRLFSLLTFTFWRMADEVSSSHPVNLTSSRWKSDASDFTQVLCQAASLGNLPTSSVSFLSIAFSRFLHPLSPSWLQAKLRLLRVLLTFSMSARKSQHSVSSSLEERSKYNSVPLASRAYGKRHVKAWLKHLRQNAPMYLAQVLAALPGNDVERQVDLLQPAATAT